MTDRSHQRFSDSEQTLVRSQLDRLTHSGVFEQSQRRQRFLEFVVHETLAGHGSRLKGYTIATEVFERRADFDPAADPVVRIEAGRLRDKLREYYETEGKDDAVRITLPKGSYRPHFEFAKMSSGAPPPADAPAMQTRWHFGPAAAVASVLLLIAGLWASQTLQPRLPLAGKPSIAVLPFTSIGNDPTWSRFADGVTEDIVTDLSHARDLLVIAQNSTAVYRGTAKDVRAIGRELGVKYVLEGSIQESNGQIRVAAQLIDAGSGAHAWSNRYDRPATDLFAVQRDVTEKIVGTLIGYGGAVLQAEKSQVRRKLPSNLTAYEYYLLALEAKHASAVGVVSREGLSKAESLFNQALAIDPQFARAYVGLAYVHEYRIDFSIGSAEDNKNNQMRAARKAVLLDPNDGEAQLVLGHAYAYHGMTEQALDQFAKAENLAPHNADVMILIAWYLPSLGQPERAVTLADRALQLNPIYPGWYNQGLRLVYFFGGNFDRAVKFGKLVAEPQALDLAYLASAAAMSGDVALAREGANRLAQMDPHWIVEKFLSENGGYPERMAELFVGAAVKAGVAACVPAANVTAQTNLIPVKSCELARQASAAVLP